MNQTVELIKLGQVGIEGELIIPEGSDKIVVFAHGSGSSRFSPRNKFVASYLNNIGMSTLLIDLLTVEEEMADDLDFRLRYDIPFLSYRLLLIFEHLDSYPGISQKHLGVFGASTGAAAALVAAAALPQKIKALVLRGARPDLASDYLPEVKTPTLMLVGENDKAALDLNRSAIKEMVDCYDKKLQVISNASHLFEEKGALEQVAFDAGGWFAKYLVPG